MSELPALYPNMWQGQLPMGLNSETYGKSGININAMYNMEYLQHRYFPRWIVTDQLRMVDLACGTGETALLIGSRSPYATLSLCDPEETALEQARVYVQACQASNIEFKDVEELEGPFNIIWSTRPLQQYSDPLAVLRRMEGLLAMDGICLICTDSDPESDAIAFWRYELTSALAEETTQEERQRIIEDIKAGILARASKEYDGEFKQLNIPDICRMLNLTDLKLLDLLHPYQYNAANYFEEESIKNLFSDDDPWIRMALAELVNGRMNGHCMVLARKDRQVIMPSLDDPDYKSLVPWYSPFLAIGKDGDRIIASLQHEHMMIDQRIHMDDLSVPAQLFDVVKWFDTKSSLEQIHRRLLPMSWDIFAHFIRMMWESEMIYVHRK